VVIHETILIALLGAALVTGSPAASIQATPPPPQLSAVVQADEPPECYEPPGFGAKYQGEYRSCGECIDAGRAAKPDGEFLCVAVSGTTDRFSLGYDELPENQPDGETATPEPPANNPRVLA
jgi:hypothetical protein